MLQYTDAHVSSVLNYEFAIFELSMYSIHKNFYASCHL